jgi:predicted deacylase
MGDRHQPFDMLLPHHSCHDYKGLIRRWREFARGNSLIMEPFTKVGADYVYTLRTPKRRQGPSIYLSAGIHGDEPASTEGLLLWARRNPGQLERARLRLFPCLNPWGLVANTRHDEHGADLNRQFNRGQHPLVKAWRAVLGEDQYDLAVALHEDYDGQGIYVYEVVHPDLIEARPDWTARLLEATSPFLPTDLREEIDGHPAEAGRISPRKVPKALRKAMPESLYLRNHHTRHSFTIETPSEFSLDDRVNAQAEATARAVELVLAECP